MGLLAVRKQPHGRARVPGTRPRARNQGPHRIPDEPTAHVRHLAASELLTSHSDAGCIYQKRRTGTGSSEEKFGGGGGNRTRVRKHSPFWLYMLVPRFVVIRRIEHGPPARRTISE